MSLRPDIQVFAALCGQRVQGALSPGGEGSRQTALAYGGPRLRAVFASAAQAELDALKAEWAHAFQHGPGVLVIRRFFADLMLVERMNTVIGAIFADESGRVVGDHFAKAGENGRIWNALQKVAVRDPATFAAYYSNPLLGLVAEAWLGPHYQMTAQVNVVRPGGQAQAPHRDYHLGFQTQDELQRYPDHVHAMSVFLTLQGAVAQTDMPLASGPTLLLPFSQQYPAGYLAWRDPVFKAYFAEHAVQLPLMQGDAVFFNPALFHAAGSNQTTDFHRSANLLQVSSAFGKPMERVDRVRMLEALYPSLQACWQTLAPEGQATLLACSCDGYSFPTNLDSDPPLYGMAPQTMVQLTRQALDAGWDSEVFMAALRQQAGRRLA